MHYHLRPGGVATVIRRQARALAEAADVLILSGEAADGFDVPVSVVPGIAYDGSGPEESPGTTAERIVAEIRLAFGGDCDVLHVHNPTLRKNSRFLGILRSLRDRGVPLFLHVHDLAEEGRPDSYYPAEEYLDDCHYGVLNSRDYRALLDSGLRPEGLHLLFNEVAPLDGIDRAEKPTRVVYPVRAIRRKNIGEALLLSLFLPENDRLAVTLPPTSPRDLPFYRDWKDFSRERSLPADFDAGLAESFGSVMSSARCALTTSLKEGFGFAFLEPWTALIPVAGRRLETVCPDFEAEGVRFPSLYRGLPVSPELFDLSRFAEHWRRAAEALFRAFGAEPVRDEIYRMFGRIASGDEVDFGALDEVSQREVIAKVAENSVARRLFLRTNPFLSESFWDSPSGLAAENSRTVRSRFSSERYRDLLLSAYRAVRGTPVRHRIDKGRLLRFFLGGTDFRIVASEVAR